ncbi:MAG: hypothetical protein LLG06_12610 [Desulfobacteraceae bacterium]|nr:hypothetical protein [Desulfobacteraceae bacterium]
MNKHLRQRVENCVATILELNRYLGDGRIRPEIVKQFERLQTYLQMVSDESVNEVDIGKIEEATRQLLDEIRESLRKSGIDYHYHGDTN